jgi:hypothetical protein
MPLFVKTENSYNPRDVHCPLCLVPKPEMKLMMGGQHKYVCAGCGFMHLGLPDTNACVRCGCSILSDKGEPKEDESFPDTKPCSKCEKQVKTIDAMVLLGGIAFRCSSCGAIGAFDKDDSRATDFKSKNPDKRSCEINETTCPQCLKKNEDIRG